MNPFTTAVDPTTNTVTAATPPQYFTQQLTLVDNIANFDRIKKPKQRVQNATNQTHLRTFIHLPQRKG